jgi:Inner membrane component of T3SS, cytoplasmic domain
MSREDFALSEYFAGDPCMPLGLVVLGGRHQGASLSVKLPLPRPLSIGSHIGCDLVLSDEDVAPLHALIFARDGELWLSRVPGSGTLLVDGVPLAERPVGLAQGVSLQIGAVLLSVESDALPEAPGPQVQQGDASGDEDDSAAPATHSNRRGGHAVHSVAAVLCFSLAALVLVLSLHTAAPAKGSAQRAAPSRTAVAASAASAASARSLEAAAKQVERYLGDPGVHVSTRAPGLIELSGTARFPGTRQQIEKIRKALPAGLDLSDAVSYPKDVKPANHSAVSPPLSSLGLKILQVAASERVPYIEIEEGERVFEGGQLNGYELLKIAPGEIVVRRAGQIQSFKVE